MRMKTPSRSCAATTRADTSPAGYPGQNGQMVPGYTRTEKRSIAEQFLVPKQVREHGLSSDLIQFEREGIEKIIDSYTREAGVRGLEREIAAVCRDVTVKLAEGQTVSQIQVNPAHVRELLS